VQMFCEKERKSTMLPQAKTAFVCSNVQFEHSPRNACELHALRGGSLDHEQHEMSEHRETANADVYQTIPRLAGDIASGRAEDS